MKNNNAQQRKAAMVRFINENGGKATMNMKLEEVQKMNDELMAKKAAEVEPKQEGKAAGANVSFKMTREKLDATIERVAAPLREEIARLKGEQPAAPTEHPKRLAYVDAKLVEKQAFDAYMEQLRGGASTLETRKKLTNAYYAARTTVQEMEKDATVRIHIADFLEDASKITREYGHRGVNAVAKVMHMGVDGVANVIEATGNLVRGNGKAAKKEKKEKAPKNKPAQA